MRKSQNVWRRACLSTFLLFALWPSRPALAGGGQIPEMGTRKTAMGAVVGRPDDLAALYQNPAGLILSPGTQLFFNAGFSSVDTSLRLRPWPGADRYIKTPVDGDGYYPAVKPSRAFGVVPMIVASTSFAGDRAVIAAGIYFPNALGAAFDAKSIARYHLIDSYIITGSASVGIAVRVHPTLTFGLALNLLYTRLSARRLFFPELHGINLGALVGSDSELRLEGAGMTASATFGLLWQPKPTLSFGLVLVTRSETRLEGDVELRLGSTALAKGSLRGRQATTMLLPWNGLAGANWDVTSWLELGLEARVWHWAEYGEQRTDIEGISFLDELVQPKGYGDSWHFAGGLRLHPPQLHGIELFLGTHYDLSPAPDWSLSMDSPTFTHVGLRSGVRWRVGPRLRLAFTYAHYWYLERSTESSVSIPPSNFVGGGVNHIMTLVVEWRLGDGMGVPGSRVFR